MFGKLFDFKELEKRTIHEEKYYKEYFNNQLQLIYFLTL